MNFNKIKRNKRKYEIFMIGLSFLWVIAAIIGILIAIGLAAIDASDGYELALLPTAIVSTLMYSVYVKFKHNSLEFKKIFVVDALQDMLPGIKYDPKKGLSKEQVLGSKFINISKGFESEDYLKGTMGKYLFEASDVISSKKMKSKENNRGKVYFYGQLFIIHLDKTTEYPVYVLPRRKPFEFNTSHLLDIELEWMLFNRKYDVFSESIHHSFYMLTPILMEKVFQTGTYHEKCAFAFVEDKLYIAINTKLDTFDIKLFRPFNQKFLESIREEITFVKHVIDTIKL